MNWYQWQWWMLAYSPWNNDVRYTIRQGAYLWKPLGLCGIFYRTRSAPNAEVSDGRSARSLD